MFNKCRHKKKVRMPQYLLPFIWSATTRQPSGIITPLYDSGEPSSSKVCRVILFWGKVRRWESHVCRDICTGPAMTWCHVTCWWTAPLCCPVNSQGHFPPQAVTSTPSWPTILHAVNQKHFPTSCSQACVHVFFILFFLLYFFCKRFPWKRGR